MTACFAGSDVPAFLLGALTPAEEQATVTHIVGCGECQAALAQLIDRRELLAHVPLSMLDRIEASRHVSA